MNENQESLVLKAKVEILRRALHILGLIQNGSDPCDWNRQSLADIFTSETGNMEDVTAKKVDSSLNLLDELGIPVNMEKGARRITLVQPLTEEQSMLAIRYYMHMVVEELGITDYLKKYVDRTGNRAVWIIARIYFAVVRKQKVNLTYDGEDNCYTIHPYGWVYRGDAIYLVAKRDKDGNIGLFRLERIRDLEVSDNTFPEDLPDISELFRHSLGAFIGTKVYNVVIRYDNEIGDRVREGFGHIELETVQKDGDSSESTMRISDLTSLCRIVFSYGGGVRIVSPPEAVDEMKKLLDGNASLYA